MPHVCFALSCAVGCTEEENMAGLEQLSRRPIVCVIVCVCVCVCVCEPFFRALMDKTVNHNCTVKI